MTSSPSFDYLELIPRFREALRRTVPRDAIALVVSRGDDELLDCGEHRAWHFPQDENGVYLGYHPVDGTSAVAHLEELRRRGGAYLAIPQPSMWWLDHYAELRSHLNSRYRMVLKDDSTCVVYSLQTPTESAAARPRPNEQPPAGITHPEVGVSEQFLDRVKALMDLEYYREQGAVVDTTEAAVVHYVQTGFQLGWSPNRLFDPAYFASRVQKLPADERNPLAHFLSSPGNLAADPNPYFDSNFYLSQRAAVRQAGGNALMDYLAHSRLRDVARPNALFSPSWYLETYPDVRVSGRDAFAHFLTVGCQAGRFASAVHKGLMESLYRPQKQHLLRGNWRDGEMVLLADGSDAVTGVEVIRRAEQLARELRLRPSVVLGRRGTTVPIDTDVNVVCLEELATSGDFMRPAAQRLLLSSLAAFGVRLFVSHDEGWSVRLRESGFPSVIIESGKATLQKVFIQTTDKRSSRVGRSAKPKAVEHKSIDLQSVKSDAELTARLIDLLRPAVPTCRVAGLSPRRGSIRPKLARRIIVPCSDWALSGVNSAVEALAGQLIPKGWDVEVLFTRDREEIQRSTGDDSHMPRLPYRFMNPTVPGLEGLWGGLIAELEREAPCIMLTAYDFAGNGVIPALSDQIGVVAWAQSDDLDYYEQLYRLGRYCNAVVGVSKRIRDTVAELNPIIGNLTHVIHNSSVRLSEIATRRPNRAARLRLVYSGRLVQYQKRIMDVLALSTALDAAGVPYCITLIGCFSRYETIEKAFREKAADHLADGRIRLTGRMPREEVIRELDQNDFYLLFSDFEGLPLSLIEGMARGCIPILPDMRSGIREVVTDEVNGLILSTRDYREWAARLIATWSDSARMTQLSRSARATVRKSFTVERIGDQFDALLTRISQELEKGTYRRPSCLNWGAKRSPSGDVLPPPSLFTPNIQLPGILNFRNR